MQIVIDIPDEEYKRLVYIDILKLRRYIENGTPLPKGHGRLIDESQIKQCGWDFVNHHAKTNAPTIIEADKEEVESEEVK